MGAVLAGLLAAMAISVLVRVWDQPLHVPFQYAQTIDSDEQDATWEAMIDKNVAETGWYFHNPELNAPYGQDWIEWPMGGDLLATPIKWGLTQVFHDPFLVMNLFWLATFPLVAAASYPALRLLRLGPALSLLGAVVYALAPYHFRNGVGHENLAFYVCIPYIVVLCVRLLGPSPPLWRWWQRGPRRFSPVRSLWPLAAAALIAFDSYYYLAFFLGLGGLSALLGALHRRDWRPLASMGVLAGTAVGIAAAAAAPTLLWLADAGANPAGVTSRPAGSTELYPLRPLELITPVAGHRFGPFATLAEKWSPLFQASSTTANLGLFAAIGMIAALVWLGSRVVRNHTRSSSIGARLGVVILLALGIAVQGSAANLLEASGIASIRAWVRIAIVIAFAGVAACCHLLADVRHRLGRRVSTIGWIAVLIVIGIVATLDQAAPAAIPDARTKQAAFESDRAFVRDLEDRLPADAMIFQLPVVPFPESGGTAYAPDYDQLKLGYLHSTQLRWSGGGMRGRFADWQTVAVDQPADVLIRGLVAVGFDAITLDTRSYLDLGRSEIPPIQAILGPPMVSSADGRVLAWDLRTYAEHLRATSSANDLERWQLQMLDAPRFYTTTDTEERVAVSGSGSFCRTAKMKVVVPNDQAWDGHLDVAVHRAAGLGDGPSVVEIGVQRVEVPADQTDVSIPMSLEGTQDLTISIPSAPACDEHGTIRSGVTATFRYLQPK